MRTSGNLLKIAFNCTKFSSYAEVLFLLRASAPNSREFLVIGGNNQGEGLLAGKNRFFSVHVTCKLNALGGGKGEVDISTTVLGTDSARAQEKYVPFAF